MTTSDLATHLRSKLFLIPALLLALAACGDGGTGTGTGGGSTSSSTSSTTSTSSTSGGGGGGGMAETPAQRGEAIVTKLGCANCHQPPDAADGTLSGQDTAVIGTMAYGANLTPDMATGIGSWTDAQIIEAIRKGVNHAGATMCGAMPRYSTFTDDDVTAIVAYLRSLPPVSRMIPPSTCN